MNKKNKSKSVSRKHQINFDDKARSLRLKLPEIEEQYIQECLKRGIEVMTIPAKNNDKHIILVPRKKNIPCISKLICAYAKYSEHLKSLSGNHYGLRRVTIPKWVNGALIIDKRPSIAIDKVSYTFNKTSSSTNITLPQAMKLLSASISNTESDEEFSRYKETFEQLHMILISGTKPKKGSLKVRRDTGEALKITASHFIEEAGHIVRKTFNATTANILFVPVAETYFFGEAQKRSRASSFTKLGEASKSASIYIKKELI